MCLAQAGHLLSLPEPYDKGLPAGSIGGTSGSGDFSSPRKVNFFSSPSPSVSTTTMWPGRSSPKRIFSERMSSISRWIVRRSGRAPRTGS